MNFRRIIRVAGTRVSNLPTDFGLVRGNMNSRVQRSMSTALSSLLAFGAFAGFVETANAQGPEVQQRVAEVKAESVRNKQALMSYNWTEQVTISLKGEVKKVQ